jgi:hypothetical protein
VSDSPDIRAGDTVNVFIKGAVVVAKAEDAEDGRMDAENGRIVIAIQYGDGDATFRSTVEILDGVTISRTNVSDGPPQLGDVWADGEGRQWFCVKLQEHTLAQMMSTGTNYTRAWADLVKESRLTLVYRATAPGEPAVTPATGTDLKCQVVM